MSVRIQAYGPPLQKLGKRKSGREQEVGIWRRKNQGKLQTIEQFKRREESRVS